MNIADIIAAIQAGGDPNQAIIQASQLGVPGAPIPPAYQSPDGPPSVPPIPFMGVNAPAGPSANAAYASANAPPPVGPPVGPPPVVAPSAGPPPVAPTSATPTGIPTPVTNPAPAPASPTALQSPPDLANMYIKLMEKNQNAAMLDSGLTLIAAGLTPNAATRQALISHAGSGGGGKGTGGITSTDLINFQKQEQANKDMLLRRSLLGGLAKQYGLSPETATYLETSGKLDEVIKHKNTQNLVIAENPADGSKAFYDQTTGKKIVDLGGPKPPETEFVKGPHGEELRRKDTGERVGQPVGAIPETTTDITNLAAVNKDREAKGLPPMGMEEFLKTNPKGTSVYISKDGVQYRPPEPGYDYERNPDGTVKIGPDGRPKQYVIEGSGAAEESAAKAKKLTAEEEKTTAAKGKAQVQSVFNATNVGKAIDNSLKLIDKTGATGPLSYAVRSLPLGGQAWTTLDSDLKTIDANVAFDALKQMRDASPTGASGLGQVTDVEQQMLKSVIANLTPHQDTEALREKLVRVKVAMHLLAENNFGGDHAKFVQALNEGIAEEMSKLKIKKQGGDPSSFGIRPRGVL